ncbi:MAG TPA: S9 family peptidase [Thermoanaerobaculia bacterium]
MTTWFALALGIHAFLGVPAGTIEAPKPPSARREAKVDVVYGEKRQDDYFWLRRKEDPQVRAHLEAENAYTDAVMKPTEPLQEALYSEMLGRIKETDLTVPFRKGDFFYYSRTEKGKQYPIYCRKKGTLDASEEVMLDANELARGEKFFAVGDIEVGDDGNLLAYSTDVTGYREYTLFVKDLRTGAVAPEKFPKVSSVAWAADNRTLFYVVDDAAKRPYRLYRHVLATEPAADPPLYEEKDEKFTLEVSRSRSRAYLFLASSSHTSSEVRFLSASDPTGPLRVVAPREKDREYEVDHRLGAFFLRVNDTGRNFRVVMTSADDPRRENWKEIVPYRDDVMIEGIEVFAGHLVLLERQDGLRRFRVMPFSTGEFHRIDLPEPVYAAFSAENREFDTNVFRFRYQSLVTPESVFDYDMDKRERKLLKRTEVLGGYDPNRYVSERLHAKAPDGTLVPISIVYRKDTKRDGASPLLLTGYGSYGVPNNPTFSSNRVSLLDRGVVIAIAHVRGGGEMGKKWHDQGRMFAKKNTFTDFIAIAEFLIRERWTSANRLAIEGGSAGGLLVGAVVNMRPDLFHVAISRVPFVDVLNTMLDPTLPLTVGEFEEWGDPRIREQYEYMRSYSPYDNIAARAYPAMLVKTSFNDSQVMYWEPAKYVARLRATKTDSNPLVFKVNMAGGHGGSSGRYDKLREAAFDYAFLLTQLGIAG